MFLLVLPLLCMILVILMDFILKILCQCCQNECSKARAGASNILKLGSRKSRSRHSLLRCTGLSLLPVNLAEKQSGGIDSGNSSHYCIEAGAEFRWDNISCIVSIGEGVGSDHLIDSASGLSGILGRMGSPKVLDPVTSAGIIYIRFDTAEVRTQLRLGSRGWI